jgi:16S rRNA (uracil1498-N3)-methyltransferase
MRIPRIYTPQLLTEQTLLELDEHAANHVGRVLRMAAGRPLTLFNGQGSFHFNATVEHVSKKSVTVMVLDKVDTHNESPLSIHLGQALSKGDKMEFTIQKAVELGVTEITPLWTEHCDIKLNQERLEKKYRQWLGIIISACEQCGRNIIPTLHPAIKIQDWLGNVNVDEKWVLDPRGQPEQNQASNITRAAIMVGPEGGLSQDEIELACQFGFKAKLIGPRVLRTETAALTAITVLQSRWGDF